MRTAYCWALHSHIDNRMHWTRDAEASKEFLECLRTQEIGYSETIYNKPWPRDEMPPEHPVDTKEAWKFLESSILTQLTRVPLDDREYGDLRYIARNYTWVDFEIWNATRPFFQILSRSHLKLSTELSNHLDAKFSSRKEIKFYQTGEWAFYEQLFLKIPKGRLRLRRLADLDLRTQATAAFLLAVPELWAGGPRFIAAFGMSGSTTLLWCFLLRTRLPGLVKSMLETDKPRLLMVELECTADSQSATIKNPIDCKRWSTLAEWWKVKTLLDVTRTAEMPVEMESTQNR